MDLTPPERDDREPPCNHFSTPLTHICTNRKRKHDDTFEFSSSPKFSSTLNDSLITNLKDICLVGSPNTPEKRSLLAKGAVSSPIQETRKILYSNIKIVKPEREKKFALRSRSVTLTKQNLLQQILNIDVIMNVVFQYLSGGDLYRVGLVSRSFLQALERNVGAFARYQIYKSHYRDNKENYVITPPASPDKCDSPPRTNSENFNKFIRAARLLTQSQSLTKCRKCNSMAVAENEIIQCQNMLACGLIYCRLCSSYSETGAKDFKDSCGHAALRPKLGNVSNQLESSFFNFSQQDSGFYSDVESTPKVRRNLFTRSRSGTPKALSVFNSNKTPVPFKTKSHITCVPVVVNAETTRGFVEGDSPPRYGGYAAGSKQSKKSLKRLTR